MSGALDLFDNFEEDNDNNECNQASLISKNVENVRSLSLKSDKPSKRKAEETIETETEQKVLKKHVETDILENIDISILENRVIVNTVETLEACTHEVASPPDFKYEPLKISTAAPAKTYPFILDPFQKEAILCIENDQSVLVSAHTSAGKTVVAEYAIARSLKDNQRVIYTTPIKALSNQKYREFSEEFGDVGLITGDVTINPSASCLIMTTEILRNMLYRGSEITREVGWVVFDEIHYMRDAERGVVWEETLILLPDNVHYVFLSATIPNARQFAEWVCHLHHQPCHVVYTDFRPTPLQHFIFPAGGDGIHLVVDEKGQFKEENFNAAMTVLQSSGDAAKGDNQRGRKGGMKNNAAQTNVFQVVKMIMERNFSPVIVFSFSKKECEIYAMQMAKLDFNTVEEKKLVDEVFNNAMDVLSEEDKKIPQVVNVLPFLRRGIGIHHGGLLPILKETIEIMFGEGLIKALFATETFAMGLNMPARTVLFTGMRKFDGKENRWITSGEYIQMSGRAGRRGLDEKGIVVLMVNEQVSPTIGREILQGKPDPIMSAFHLTYNMVLNLLRVEEINPEYMMERSFFQFQNQASIPELYNKHKDKYSEYNSFNIENEGKVKSYYKIQETIDDLYAKHRTFIIKPKYLIPFLHPGRLIKIKQYDEEFDWGVIINHKKTTESYGHGSNKDSPLETKLVIDILLNIKTDSNKGSGIIKACPPGEAGSVEVVPVSNKLVMHISSVRVHLPSDLRPPDARKSVLKILQQVKKRFPDGPPLLNPINDMQIKDPDFKEINDDLTMFRKRLQEHPLHNADGVQDLLANYKEKAKCWNELENLTVQLKKAKSLLQMDELKNRKKVLRRLGYCDESDVIHLKGRIACELSSADELLLTEMIFNGIFDAIKPALCVSLLSCFVCDEKSKEMPARAEELSGPLRQMQDLARRIAKVSKDSKLNIEEDSYVEKFKPSLMDVVYAWCNGSSFTNLCQMTDIFEGSIIRCMRRLEELLRQLCQAAKSMGNSELENKFSEGIRLIKRDIIFAASLYL